MIYLKELEGLFLVNNDGDMHEYACVLETQTWMDLNMDVIAVVISFTLANY